MRRLSAALSVMMIMLSACAILPKHGDARQPRFVTANDITLLGVSRTAPIRELDYAKVWETFFAKYSKTQHVGKHPYCGVSYAPEGANRDKDSLAAYFVGAPAESFTGGTEALERHVIRGGAFAVFTHRGPVEEIHKTYAYIYGEWFPSSGYQSGDSDMFEYYDERFKDNSPDSVVEIWVPVKK
jgi:AraC family transcriptional regulator